METCNNITTKFQGQSRMRATLDIQGGVLEAGEERFQLSIVALLTIHLLVGWTADSQGNGQTGTFYQLCLWRGDFCKIDHRRILLVVKTPVSYMAKILK